MSCLINVFVKASLAKVKVKNKADRKKKKRGKIFLEIETDDHSSYLACFHLQKDTHHMFVKNFNPSQRVLILPHRFQFHTLQMNRSHFDKGMKNSERRTA